MDMHIWISLFPGLLIQGLLCSMNSIIGHCITPVSFIYMYSVMAKLCNESTSQNLCML